MTSVPDSHHDPLLTVTDLRLEIGRRVLVQDLSFQVRRGEFWCVLGANGSGKTTLLNGLAGLSRPASGRIELLGRLRQSWRPGAAACLCGYLPQGGDSLFGVTALQAALLGRHPHAGGRLWESADDIDCALQALTRMDMAGQAERDIGTLSGGERQRVAAASLLAQDPLLYVLDEPLNHLDLKHQIALMDVLREQTCVNGRAVITTLHDLSLAARYATHVVLMPPAVAASGVASGTALMARAQAGLADQVLQPDALARAFGHPLQQVITPAGWRVFVPG